MRVGSEVPRRPRLDEPGSWHHVVNRGLAKRPLFESRADIRHFLAQLARQVHAGRIEIHAYSLLTTHFHLLVRSPIGALSEAMRQAQNVYARRFNRIRRRDGALVRGRYSSRRVACDEYLHALVRYIDNNAVSAGLALAPEEYAFGSARHYVFGDGPRWLERRFVDAEARRLARSAASDAAAYRLAFGNPAAGDSDALSHWIDSRLAARVAETGADDLLAAACSSDRSWMTWKARLADGHRPGLPVCAPAALRRAIEESVRSEGVWMVEDGPRTWRGAEVARVGMLHQLCGWSHRAISAAEGSTADRARLLCVTHQRLLREHEAYGARVMAIGRVSVLRTVGAGP